MRVLRFFVVALVFCFAVSAGNAAVTHSGKNSPSIKVRINHSFFFPATDGIVETDMEFIEAKRLMVYGMAQRECDLIKQVLADTCNLRQLNISINHQNNSRQRGYRIQSTANYTITLKAPAEGK